MSDWLIALGDWRLDVGIWRLDIKSRGSNVLVCVTSVELSKPKGTEFKGYAWEPDRKLLSVAIAAGEVNWEFVSIPPPFGLVTGASRVFVVNEVVDIKLRLSLVILVTVSTLSLTIVVAGGWSIPEGWKYALSGHPNAAISKAAFAVANSVYVGILGEEGDGLLVS